MRALRAVLADVALGVVVLGAVGFSQSEQPSAGPATAGSPTAKFGPHTQATLPPIPISPYPVRPTAIVAAVYRFAAEHPEVLSYVPCYCGCERSGHRGNDDCFVAKRAANGDVTGWEPHGAT